MISFRLSLPYVVCVHGFLRFVYSVGANALTSLPARSHQLYSLCNAALSACLPLPTPHAPSCHTALESALSRRCRHKSAASSPGARSAERVCALRVRVALLRCDALRGACVSRRCDHAQRGFREGSLSPSFVSATQPLLHHTNPSPRCAFLTRPCPSLPGPVPPPPRPAQQVSAPRRRRTSVWGSLSAVPPPHTTRRPSRTSSARPTSPPSTPLPPPDPAARPSPAQSGRTPATRRRSRRAARSTRGRTPPRRARRGRSRAGQSCARGRARRGGGCGGGGG